MIPEGSSSARESTPPTTATFFTDTESTGEEVERHRTATCRIENGVIAEASRCFDTLVLLQQIDAIPAHSRAYDLEALGGESD